MILTPTQQIRMNRNALENFENKGDYVLSILDKDNLTANNLGLAKAEMASKDLSSFESEIDGLLAAHNDLGDAIYYLDVSSRKQRWYFLA